MDDSARDLLLCRMWDKLNRIGERMSAQLTPVQVSYQGARAVREGYLHRVLVAFDDFWNVATGGLPDETISSRAERDAAKHELLATVLTKALDLLQSNHGQKAQAGDLARAEKVEGTEAQSLGVAEP